VEFEDDESTDDDSTMNYMIPRKKNGGRKMRAKTWIVNGTLKSTSIPHPATLHER
jgi:hypothetical protein